jgi:spermidine dehydrogenase
MNGGTLEIDSPRPYSAVAMGLLKDLGVDVAALARKVEHPGFYRSIGLRRGAFFDRESFGADHLAVGAESLPMARFLARSPLSTQARLDLARIVEGAVDYLPGMSGEQKKDRLSRISYRDFLRDLARVDAAVLAYYQALTHAWWGVGADAVSALDCWGMDYPGFKGLELPPGAIQRMGPTPAGYKTTGGSARLHFPDGNATIARLLVRALVPAVMPGTSATDAVTAQADYSQLDRAGSATRVRLNSTVLNVARADGGHVDVVYVQGGERRRVQARHCVMACWNMMIPYLCPQLPPVQKAALKQQVKTPLVYTSVALRNWRAFARLGVHDIYSPGCYFSSLELNSTVDIGAYTLCTRTVGVRPEPGGTQRAAEHAVRGVRTQYPRTAGAHPGAGWLRSGQRYRRHYRESLAAWLCARIQPAV